MGLIELSQHGQHISSEHASEGSRVKYLERFSKHHLLPSLEALRILATKMTGSQNDMVKEWIHGYILTYEKPGIIFTYSPDDVPCVPGAHKIVLRLEALFDVLGSCEWCQAPFNLFAILVRVIHHRQLDQYLQIVTADRQRLLDGVGILRDPLAVSVAVLQFGAWNDNGAQPTKGAIGDFQFEHLARKMIHEWIWRR